MPAMPSLSRLQLTLIAATLGWGLDAFDFTMFLFAIPSLSASFSIGTGFTGFILTCTSICSAIGGLVFWCHCGQIRARQNPETQPS
jgi:MFS family permease